MKYFFGIIFGIIGLIVLLVLVDCHTFTRSNSYYERRAGAIAKNLQSSWKGTDRDNIKIVSVELIDTKYFPWAIRTYEVEWTVNRPVPSIICKLPDKFKVLVGVDRPSYESALSMYLP